jgi:hypothetical protein
MPAQVGRSRVEVRGCRPLAELRRPAPIGVALADPVAGARQTANPHLVRTQALGLAGWRVGGAATENAAMVSSLMAKIRKWLGLGKKP